MGNVQLNDEQLITRAVEGDRAAMDELLAKYEGQIYRFGLRMCGSEEDARDVLQETLLAAFKGVKGFRGQANLSTWLFTVARSFCIKARRRHVGEPAATESLDTPKVRSLPEGSPSPDQAAHAKEIGRALHSAVQALTPEHREVILLKDVEGLSAEETAAVLGESVAGVKSRLHRARMALRETLTTLMGTEGAGGPGPCPALAEELSSYATENIDQATCARIEAHMARCPRCVAACETLKKTVSLCRRMPGTEVPPSVQSAVRQAVLAGLGSPSGD
jgi:RNA polymerase sigma-70 factor (ECF subfamily)